MITMEKKKKVSKKAMEREVMKFLKNSKKEQKRIYKKAVWSEIDYRVLYHSYAKRKEIEFYIPIKKIQKLASDKRTPKKEKIKLLQILASKQTNKPNG